MKALILFVLTTALLSGETLLFDFSSKKTSGNWYIVNDDVMGGISQSKFDVNADGIATFSGILSPENYGGFASVRAMINPSSDVKYTGVSIRIKGDGNVYNLRFRTTRSFDGYAYQAKMQSEKDTWVTIRIPFENFKPTFRGRTLTDKPALESNTIEQIGILIADEQFGEFSVDIDWIKFF